MSRNRAAEHHLEEARELLQAEASPGSQDQQVNQYNSTQLMALVDPKNAYVLEAMGGLDGLSKALNTNPKTGLVGSQLTDAEIQAREKIYGCNVLPEKKTMPLWMIMWQTLNDKVLIILMIAAIISLALGLYETFGGGPEYDPEGRLVPKVDWVEGVAILVAVAIVTIVGSVNDWQKERQFAKLNRRKDDRVIQVIRDGNETQISVHDVLVGDLVSMQPGDVLPVDGVLVKSFDIECDESSATGESDTLRKVTANVAMHRLEQPDADFDPHAKKVDCMILSGAKVLEGTGVYMVTAVGENSMFGRTLLSLQHENEATPLQEKLNRIADGIAKFGVGSALILFIVLFIRFLVQISHGGDYEFLPPSQKGSQFMDIFIVSVTIIVVAVPEGLPLAVTLALAFATTRMIKDNNLVRVLKSCETMGGATTVCSDKTGTLTQNKMTVVAATVGTAEWSDEGDAAVDAAGEPVANTAADEKSAGGVGGAVGAEVSAASVCEPARDILLPSILLNSSVFEDVDDPANLLGSKTETALIGFARTALGFKVGDLKKYRDEFNLDKVLPFDSSRKYMLSAYDLPDGGMRVLLKGAAEIVLSKCTTEFSPNGPEPVNPQFYLQQVDNYGNLALRAIGAAYRDFDATEAKQIAGLEASEIPLKEFTFLALFGIKDPLRPGVTEAVAQCRRAGVVVRMVTGDNVRTARAIALNAGILQPDDKEAIVMEGPEFRKLSDEQLTEIVPRLRVLARSSPEDKRTLVAFLKKNGDTVAVTGDGTNDAPALKLADVGFSMGITGTEVAKEASDIIIMDDNFASIVNAIKWGRTVNDAVKKFLQFQLTVNITAVVLTFVSAVANKDNHSVLTAVQLLWVNLIMDTLAALALATDAPVDTVLDRPPDNRKASLITVNMWKMILGQSFFQLCVTFVLHFAGPSIWGVAGHVHDSRIDTQLAAMVFNAFVWCQFFKLFVARRLDNKQNIFEGLSKNYFFPVIAVIIAGFQVLIMFVGGAAFSIRRQTGAMWATAVICGLGSFPMGVLIRLVPDEVCEKYFPHTLVRYVMKGLIILNAGLAWVFSPVTWLFSKLWAGLVFVLTYMFCCRAPRKDAEDSESIVDSFAPARSHRSHAKDKIEYEWMPPIQNSVEQLRFLRSIHGGRVSRVPRVFNWHQQSHQSNHLQVPPTSSGHSVHSGSSLAAFMAPVVVSGAIGGWNPTPVNKTG